MIHHHTKPSRWRAFFAILGLLAATLTVAVGVAAPASANSFTVYAPWDSGKTFAVGSPGGQVGGGYYGHTGGEYYAVDINGPGGGNADCGEPVRATGAGTVTTGSYGSINWLRIAHGGDYVSEYQHMQNVLVKSGTVTRGQKIGEFGNVGTTYCHLHFVVRLNGASFAPSPMSGVVLPNSGGAWVTSNNSPVSSTPTTGPDDPNGNYEAIQQVAGGVRLTGWALDPNTADPIAVHVYEGNCCANPRGAFTANVARPDVGAAFPGKGDNHGFDITLGLPNGVSGSKTYCVYAINTGAGSTSPELGCRTVNFNWNPIGNYESIIRVPGGVQLSGWALDPDTSNPIDLHVYEGNCCTNPRGAFAANQSRPDVGAAWPGHGNNHGFGATVGAWPSSTTNKTYCAYAINTGYGNSSPELGCRSITISPDAVGNFESLTAVSGGAQVGGWTLDPDVASSTEVHVYEGSNIVAIVPANLSRTDVGSAWPGYGNLHGFDFKVTLSPGFHTLCAFGVNAANTAGISNNIGCRNVTVS